MATGPLSDFVAEQIAFFTTASTSAQSSAEAEDDARISKRPEIVTKRRNTIIGPPSSVILAAGHQTSPAI